MKSKNMIAVLLAAALLTGCVSGGGQSLGGSSPGVPYTDSLGRTVSVPKNIERVASSGPIADVFLYCVCPDKMVGFATKFPEMSQGYIAQKYLDLPVYGQYYGKNANMNIEALIAAAPQIIVDIGQSDPNMKESLDSLQAQSGIPVVSLDVQTEDQSALCNKLGELLGTQQTTAPLAEYCKNTQTMLKEGAEKLGDTENPRVYYALGANPLSAISSSSLNGAVISAVGAKNVADFGSQNGKSNVTASMEQVILWDPEVILLDSSQAYSIVKSDPAWAQLNAVRNGRVYKIPVGPYNFMGNPAAVNQIIGAKWFANLLYPQIYNYDIRREIKEFYEVAYHCRLTDEQVDYLLQDAKA